MIYVAILLLLVAIMLFWISSRQRRAAGLPAGRLIYSDTSHWAPVEKPLYDAILGITGKPDYLIDQDGVLIPVEVKSKRVSQAPYDSHIYQLAAYILLAQRVFGKRPPYGILHYPNRTFAIDYTPGLEASLLSVIAEMRKKESLQDIGRSHDSPERCLRCGYSTICDQALRL